MNVFPFSLLDDVVRTACAVGQIERARIIYLLAQHEALFVKELVELLGDIKQPSVSQHLKVLRRAGVVKASRCGKAVSYSLTNHSINQYLRERFVEGKE